ncbi:MAG: hypothetical protein E7667_01670 [Ruminococcaceae bacterium]|nr:hypothetical protein [Oscillospiraceae bacterium]
MKKFCYILRVLTVAPIIAAITFCILRFVSPEIMGGNLNFIISLLCITVLPLLAYPLQPIMPKFKGRGRDGQRNLAIIMSVIGYIVGIICAFALNMPAKMTVLLITYFISGILIFLFNKAFKVKASGHACGVAGPIAYLTYVYGPIALLGIPLLGIVAWSSIYMGRHKWTELVVGGSISVASLFISIIIVNFL